MDTTSRESLLRIYPVLQELPAHLLKKVDAAAVPVQGPLGQRLFGDGSPCSHYPLLVDGTIRVSKSSAEGHEMLLYYLARGESCVLTVLALLGDGSYPAIGTAETPFSLLGVPKGVFLDMILESSAFRGFVFSSLSKRITHLMALVDDVAFRRVNERLAARLLLHRPPITATHQELADELGTSREVVSRILESFKQSGIIRLGRKRIEILDPHALAEVHRSAGAATAHR